MKKLLVSMAATLIAGSAFAQTSANAETKIGGDFRTRFFSFDNYTGKGGNDAHGASFFTNRAKVNVSVSKGDSLSAFVSLIHNNTFGSAANNTNPVNDLNNANYNTGSGKNDSSLQVSQAYGWWNANDMISLTLGRMAIDLGDGKFFSYNDWQSLPTTHDGIKGSMNFDFASLDLYVVRSNTAGGLYGGVAGSTNARNLQDESYIANFGIKNLPEVIKTGNLLFVQQTNQVDGAGTGAATPRTSTLQHYGLSASGEIIGLFYDVAAGFQTGKSNSGGVSRDRSGNMFDVLVGYQMPETMAFKAWVGYHQDSGNKSTSSKDAGYDALYYNIRENGGKMDVLRWGNLTYARVGASIKPMENTEFGAEYLLFSRTEKNAGVNTGFAYLNTAVTGSSVSLLPTGASAALGNEIDLWARHSYDNGFNVGLVVGMFAPGAALKDNQFTKSMTQVMLEGGLSF